MRVLIVGFGSIARRHLANLRACGASQVTVLRPRGAALGAPPGVEFVASIDEALARRPELAVIASPSAAHAEALVPLIEHDVPCYVEKPAVTTPRDLDRVGRALSATANLVTFSGVNLRFLPSLQRMRECVQRGLIGRPIRASLQAGQWLPDWRPGRNYRESYSAFMEAGGGVVFDLVHELDMARWLFGEFDEVRALGGKLSRLEIMTEDTACILLGGRHRAPLVAVSLDYVSREPLRRYDIVGEEGNLSWDLRTGRLVVGTASGSETLDAEPRDFDVSATYVAAMRAFVSAVQQRKPTTPDLADGLASAALALRVKDALQQVPR